MHAWGHEHTSRPGDYSPAAQCILGSLNLDYLFQGFLDVNIPREDMHVMPRFVISMTSYWLRNHVGNGRQALNAVSTGHLPAKHVPQQSDTKILVHFSQVCDAAKPSCFIVKCSDICCFQSDICCFQCFARYELRSLCPERSSACSGQIRWGSCVMPGALNGPKRSTTAFAAIRYFSRIVNVATFVSVGPGHSLVVFATCLQDLLSFILGISSISFFANCFLPQIILNFVNGSSDGLSVGMILVWSLGDMCNLIGVCLTGAVSMTSYYTSLDLV